MSFTTLFFSVFSGTFYIPICDMIVLWFVLTYPPRELVTAGFAIECYMETFFGPSRNNVFRFHSQRNMLHLTTFACVPLGIAVLISTCSLVVKLVLPYFGISGNIFAPSLALYENTTVCLIPLVALMYWAYHYSTDYYNYGPIKKIIEMYPLHTIEEMKNFFADELRDFMNLDTPLEYGMKLIFTSSWLIYAKKFSFSIVRLRDVRIVAVGASEFDNVITGVASQLVDANIIVSRAKTSFKIRVSLQDFRDIEMKLLNRVEVTPGLQLPLSQIDKFLVEFKAEVEENDKYYLPANIERNMCLGCNREFANVKIICQCGSDHCQNCQCAPFWCLSCLSTAFAFSQINAQDGDQHDLDVHSYGRCPTCRAVYCVKDVHMVEVRDT